MRAERVSGAGPDPRAGAVFFTSGYGGFRGALRLVLAAEAGAVRAALARVTSALEAAGVAPDDAGIAELVLAEALNNIVEHAFDGSGDAGRIELTIVPGAVGIGCELRDNGRPMPGGKPPCPAVPGTPPPPCAKGLDALPEGGFGWYLIRRLACDVAYTREAGANRLVLRVPYGLHVQVSKP